MRLFISFFLVLMLMLTLTPLASAGFMVVNDSDIAIMVIYGYWDYSYWDDGDEGIFRIRGYYHVPPNESGLLWTPEEVTEVFARIWPQTQDYVVEHDRESYEFPVHPSLPFEVFSEADGTIVESNVPHDELVTRGDFYEYANNTAFRFTALASGSFTVANDSDVKIEVIYGYWDGEQSRFRVKGYYHIPPNESKSLWTPAKVTEVFARIWQSQSGNVVEHDRESYQSSRIHPRLAFDVFYKQDGTIVRSDVPHNELVTRGDFYKYANNTTFRYHQPGGGSVNIPDPNLRAAIKEALGKASGAAITVADMLKLKRLIGEDRGIENLTGLEFATNLTELSLKGNKIGDISVLARLTNLTELSLKGNKIGDISVLARLTNLTYLHLSNNKIGDVSALARLTNLTKLYLHENNIGDISVLANLTKLTSLVLWNNKIGDISVLARLTNLTYLHLSNNKIGDVSALARLTNLTKLYLHENNIGDISVLANLTKLTSLVLWNNKIGDISVLARLTNLTYLHLSSNKIGDISVLANLTKLTSLHLSSNKIGDISVLANLTKLTSLHLRNNKISDFSPIAGLIPNLEYYSHSGQRVESPAVNIPDPNLRAAIKEALGKASGAVISRADMLKLKKLIGEDRGIENLTGLEFATNLTVLRLKGNKIGDVSALAGLTNLTYLSLWENNIGDISALARLTKLTKLYLSKNNIGDVSALARLTNLTYLSLWENNIGDISALARLTKLTKLYLSKNNIGDVSALAGLTNLTYLSLWENNIADISVLANLTNLTELYLSKNKIGDISALARLTKLTKLTLHNNKISDFSPIAGLIPNLTEYRDSNQRVKIVVKSVEDPIPIPDRYLHSAINVELNRWHNPTITLNDMLRLSELSTELHKWVKDLTGLEFAINLKELYLSKCEISDLSPLANLKNLERLDLDYNWISDISPLANLKNLEYLDLSDNRIFDVSPLANLKNLKTLYLSDNNDSYNNRLSDISPLANLKNLKTLVLHENSISDISPLANLKNLEELVLAYNWISDISPLANLKNLKELNLGWNSRSDFSLLANLKNLEKLVLHYNKLSDLSPLANLKNLKTLELHNNKISDISPLANLKNLKTLELHNNKISDISPLANLVNLEKLSLDYNWISDISPLANLKNLKTLSLSNNHISDFSPIAALIPNLEVYHNSDQGDLGKVVNVNIPDPGLRAAIEEELGKAKGAAITNRDMYRLLNLDASDAGIRELTGLEFAINLKFLDLDENQITNVSVPAGLKKLESLDLDRNLISDISPLASLKNLKWLDLNYNKITNVSLSGLKSLESLDLGYNQITKISLSGLDKLRELSLINNKLTDISTLASLKSLRDLDLRDNYIVDFSPLEGMTFWVLAKGDQQGLLVPGGGSVKKTTNRSGATVYTHSDGNETVLIKGVDLEGLSSSKGYADYTAFLPPYYGKHFRLYDQGDNNTCGQNSARILLYYYGIKVSEGTFDAMADIYHTVVGVTPYEMLEGLNFSFGVQAHKYLKPVSFVLPNTHSQFAVNREYNKTAKDLKLQVRTSRPPIIVTRVNQWGYHHVVVIGYDTKSNAFLIADPNGLFYWQKWDKWTALTRYDPPVILPPLKVMWSLDNLFFQELVKAAKSPNSEVWRGIYDDLSEDQANLAIKELSTRGEFFKFITTESPFLLGPLKWLIADPLGFLKPYSMFVPKKAPQYHDFASETFTITQWGPDHDDLWPCEHRPWSQTKSVNGKVKAAIFGAKPVRSTCKLGLGFSASYNAPDIDERTVTVSGRIEEGLKKTYGSKGFLVGALTIYYKPTSAAPTAPSLSLSSHSPATALLPNYPNPFNPETWIPYQLAEPAEVTLNIYAVDGKLIRTLALGHQTAGAYHTKARAAYWDGRNSVGERVASGIYFYTITAGEFTATQKMLIRK